jgi:ABC-2 type transport system ATP-binding protein
MIHLDNVSYRYNQQSEWLLRNASLQVPHGALIGMLGPNGCGKTTLFHQIAGTASLRLETGRITVDCPVAERNLVVQHVWLPGLLTVNELIGFVGNLNGVSRTHARARYLDTLPEVARARCTKIGDRLYRALSGGERQWLAVSLGLLYAKRLALLDEPTSGLDPQFRLLVWDIIRHQQALGKTIVVSSHLIEEIAYYTDELVLIRQQTFERYAGVESMRAAYGGANCDEAFVNAFNRS